MHTISLSFTNKKFQKYIGLLEGNDDIGNSILSMWDIAYESATNSKKTKNTMKIEHESVTDFCTFVQQQWPLAHIQDWSAGGKSHVGDIWITFPKEQKTIMFEMKNYTTNVPSTQIQKFWDDWTRNEQELDGAIFISWNSGIACHKKIVDISYWGPRQKPIIFLSFAKEHTYMLQSCIDFLLAYCSGINADNYTNIEKIRNTFCDLLYDIDKNISEYKRKIITETKKYNELKGLLDSLPTKGNAKENTKESDDEIEIIY